MIRCINQNMFYNLVHCASCNEATTRSTYQNSKGMCYSCKTAFKKLDWFD